MTIRINGLAVPASMAARAKEYAYSPPPALAVNGMGLAVPGRYARLVWTWAQLSQAEMEWWCSTLLDGAASAAFAGPGCAVLLNHLNVESSVAGCVVHRPTYRTTTGAAYLDVTVRIERIEEGG